MLHWIYATSFKPTGLPYYAAVDGPYIAHKIELNSLPERIRERYKRMKERVAEKEPYIWGHNVTERYINLYKESIKNSKLAEDELMANIVVFIDQNTSNSESRVSCRVDVFAGDKNINFGYSPGKTDDMNQFLQFKLQKNKEYSFVVSKPENKIDQTFTIHTGTAETKDIQLVLNN